MSERDFTIGSREFKLSKINALLQYHLIRRLSPILSDLMPAMKEMSKIQDKKELTEEDQFDLMAKFAEPVLSGFSKLSDVDSEKVLIGLLTAVEIKQSEHGNWAKISNGTQIMFMDLELPILLQAAGRAFMFNMKGFFSDLPRK